MTTLTGNISSLSNTDGSYYYTMVFERVIFQGNLVKPDKNSYAPIIYPVPSSGEVSLNLLASDKDSENFNYKVTLISYEDTEKTREIYRQVYYLFVTGTTQDIYSALVYDPNNIPTTTKTVIFKGSSLSWGFIYLDDNNKPVDISSITVRARLKNSVTGQVINLTTSKTNASKGEFEVSMSSTTSASLSLGEYNFYIQYSYGTRVQSTTQIKINVLEGY